MLLKNDHGVLPLSAEKLNSVAVIGPLADAPYEQLGTWIFDGDPELSITPLDAIHSLVGHDVDVRYVRAMENSRSRTSEAFDEAAQIARDSDVALLFLGEESILSGEAHSRADINLPGDQAELVRRIRSSGQTGHCRHSGRPTADADQHCRQCRCDSVCLAPGNDGRAGDCRSPVWR